MFGRLRSATTQLKNKNIMPTKSKAAKTAPAKKAAKTEKVVRVTKNDITRPKPGGNTARVWEIADELTEKTGTPAIRKDVLAKVEAEKIPLATGQTQYNLWRQFNGLTGRLPTQKPVKAEKVKLPKPPAKARGKIGSQKVKLPKPPAKKEAAPAASTPAAS